MPTDLSIQWLPILPGWAVVLIAAVLAGLLVYGSFLLLRKKVPACWVAFLGGWRVVIGAVFVIALMQPVISYTRPVEQLPELIVLVDTSKSMGRPGATSGASRLDEVRNHLQKGELGTALQRRHKLHWFTFAGNAAPIAEANLGDIRPLGSTTRYAESLTTAADLLRASGATPQRVLLVSDGNDLGATDPVEAAQRLGLTVDTLGPSTASATSTVPSLAIADVQSARRVLLGSETHFRVSVRGASAQVGAKTSIRLLENGKELARQEVSLKPGWNQLRVPFAHRPTAAGEKRYEFRLGDDNAKPYPLSVQVVDGKNEVLILEDSWRWDFKYLRRVFEDDPSYRFTAILSRGGGAFVQFGAPDRRVKLVGFPQGRAELEGFDTIVLGDVNVRSWPRGLASAVAQLVRDEGKSLVLMAGPNLATLADVPELNALLPVEVARETATPLGGPVDVRISEDGVDSPFFFLPRDAEGETAALRLPALDQIYAPRRKRPGATVLLEATKLKNTYGNLIVMAEHTVGRGRVLYVGTDTLWKWQTLGAAGQAGATPYSSFWQQAFRALTPTRPSMPGINMWLTTSRSRAEVGRRVAIRADIDTDRALPNPGIQATVVLPDDRRVPLAFSVDPTDPTLFRVDLEPSLVGPHRITASLTSEGKTVAETTALIDVEDSRAEEADTGVDQGNLARIATGTGGRSIDPNKPETWPTNTEPAPTIEQKRTIDLWSNYTLLLLLCGMLGVDWMVRLLRHYV